MNMNYAQWCHDMMFCTKSALKIFSCDSFWLQMQNQSHNFISSGHSEKNARKLFKNPSSHTLLEKKPVVIVVAHQVKAFFLKVFLFSC